MYKMWTATSEECFVLSALYSSADRKAGNKNTKKMEKKGFDSTGASRSFGSSGHYFFFVSQPQTYEGGAQITYTDNDKSYKVLLTFSEDDGTTGHAQGERTDTLSEGMDSALPCQLYVLDQETGKLAGEEFADKVETCKVDTKAAENSLKMEFIEPMYNESFPYAAYVSDIYFTSDSGTNDIEWTLSMKNGDTILLSTRLTIEERTAVRYYSEDTAMETTEELQALLDSIERDVTSDTPVYLYLPAVTYDGEVTFGNHIWCIYGGAEGDNATTFTGTVNMKGLNGNYAEINEVNFLGNSGTGLNSYCLVLLSQCSFDGWDTAALAQNGAWINAMDCTFTNNKTALKFNTSMSYGSAPNYPGNVFSGNGTAVSIVSLPGNETLDFAGSTFSGNDTDIDNKVEHSVNTANAIFE